MREPRSCADGLFGCATHNINHIQGKTMTLTTVELCAGAGGQALGVHRAGFEHLALIDNDELRVTTGDAA